MTRTSRTPPLRFAWLGLVLATAALLCVPPSHLFLGSEARVIWAPAILGLRGWAWLQGSTNPALFPLFAAAQLVVLGMLCDAPSQVRQLRRGARWKLMDVDALLPWKALLLLVTISVTGTYLVLLVEEPSVAVTNRDRQDRLNRERHHMIQKRLAAVSPPSAETRRVFLVGDSRFASMMKRGTVMEKQLSVLTRGPVEVVDLCVSALEFMDLDRYLDSILSLEPDLVVVESSALFLKTSHRVIWGHVARAERWANMALDRLDTWLSRDREDLRFVQPQVIEELTAREDDEDEHQRRATRWRGREATRTDPNYRLAQRVLATFRKEGIPVALLDAPPGDRVHAVAPRFFAESAELCDSLARETDAMRWVYAETLPDLLFEDGSHFNEKGRDALSPWLFQSITGCLMENQESADEGVSFRLSLDNSSYDVGQALTLRHDGGVPGQRVVVFLVEVNGVPLVRSVLSGRLDGDGTWVFTAPVPVADPGLNFALRSFSKNGSGVTIATNKETLTIR